MAYVYCLSCDGALSQRIEYSTTSSTTITSWRRYEYDGLNLLRVDEKYDSAGGTIGDTDNWRMKELATHKPGSLGNMLGKKVYNYSSTNYTDTPTSSAFYAYHYDAVGNVLWLTDSGGVLSHSFTQDAFGNALATGNFSGTTWSAARTAGITEHQTGKWIDPFTGLYFFSARWYDSGVGRFVGRDPVDGSEHYMFVLNSPSNFVDPTGLICNIVVKMQGTVDVLYRKPRHMWLDWGDNSAGWWPSVSYDEFDMARCRHVPGMVKSPDPLNANPTKTAQTQLRTSGIYQYGPMKGENCCMASACSDVRKCVQAAVQEYPTWYPTYSCYNNCHHFVSKVLKSCCMDQGEWAVPIQKAP